MSKKKQRTVGFAFTGSFCTYEKIKEVVIPIFSGGVTCSTSTL